GVVGKRELAESSELIGSRLPGEIESDLQVGYIRRRLNGMLTMNRIPPEGIPWPFVDSFSQPSYRLAGRNGFARNLFMENRGLCSCSAQPLALHLSRQRSCCPKE